MAIGRRRTAARVAGLLMGASALLAGGAAVALAADHAVGIAGFAYSPASLTIVVGDTVTWTNSDTEAHTTTADDASWDSGSIANGASGTVTFSTAGTFPYHCPIHPARTGTITVQAAAGGGGGGATTPPTDTAIADVPATAAGGGPALGLALVGAFLIGGLAVARRLAARD